VILKNGEVKSIITKKKNHHFFNGKEEFNHQNEFANVIKLGAPRGLALDKNYDLIISESQGCRVMRITPTDWETAKWIFIIYKNVNEFNLLLPEIITQIAILAYTRWRF